MKDDDLGLRNKVVLITSANNPIGIGVTTAVALVDVDAKVFVRYLRIAQEIYGISAQEARAAT